jgi:hypothetical protein
VTVLADLKSRLTGHTCYAGCADLLCLAAREIERLGGRAEKAESLIRRHMEERLDEECEFTEIEMRSLLFELDARGAEVA